MSRDTLLLTQKFLRENPGECSVAHAPSAQAKGHEKQSIEKHEHGSAACIAAFLSTKNWSVRRGKQ